MNREVHVRICEGRGVIFPPHTRRPLPATRRSGGRRPHHDREPARARHLPVIVVRPLPATVSMDELPLVGSDPCRDRPLCAFGVICRPVSYTHLRAHETDSYLVCRLL